MLGVLAAFALFAGIVAGDVTGTDYLSAGPTKLCQVMGGKYDGRVNTVGHNREYADAPNSVPYCTAGPSTLLEPIIAPLVDKAKGDIRELVN